MMNLTSHQLQDFLLYIPFLLGQLLYVMKRAGFSMRAGRAKTRRAYLYQNWDVLGFRAGLEIVIFSLARHLSFGQIIGFFHIDLSSFTSLAFLNKPIDSPVAIFFLGIASDGLVDWAVDWASRKDNTKVPQRMKDWLSENVGKDSTQ